MCRLVAYLGEEVLLDEVLVKPINSIIMQSLQARESDIPTNGDGFGVGWYVPSISDAPALFTSISPAWGDRNLLNLTAKIKSTAFFAHVRAASEGGVTHYNCHPFVYGQWMLMHNGGIADFIMVKRHLRHLLDDDIYNWIKGDTDSEHLFALFLQLAKGRDLSQLTVVADVLEETFETVLQLVQRFNAKGTSYFNIALTDGKRLIVTRYCNDVTLTPETLHYTIGSYLINRPAQDEKQEPMMQTIGRQDSILVSSEKLNNFDAEWKTVPPNHLLMVDEAFNISLRALK